MNRNNNKKKLVNIMFNNSFVTMITILTFNTLSVVIDGIFIGRGLGVDSTKAFGLASPLVLFLTAVAGLFSSGCQALCMNNMGAGNHNEAKEVFSTTFVDVVIISVILTILPAFFPKTVAVTLGARGNLVQKASEYIWGYSFGIPSILITGVFLSLMQIEGKNKLISISILLTTITNLAGDFINIVYLKGGLFGMGLTTTISSYFSLAIVLHFYLSKKSFFSIDLWKYRFNHNKDIISLGMPTAALRTCKSLNAYTLNLILVFIGSEIGVAALSVVNNIILMFGCICPAVGLSAALIAAALYGEENKTGLVDLLKHSMKIGILCSVILSVTLFVFADSFVSLFIKDPSAVIETAKYLRIAALGQPLLTINQCLANMYQSMKKKKMSTVLRILEAWGFILVSALILSRFWGEKGVFIALPVGEVMSTLFILIIVAINKKSPRIHLEDLLLLDRSFGVDDSDIWERSISQKNEMTSVLEEVENFLTSQEKDSGTRQKCILVLEEICGNIMEHGFIKSNNIIEIKVISNLNGVTIRIRDNCKKFDPVKYWETVEQNDREHNIGLRIVMKTAKNIIYSNIVKMNNLIIEF